MDFKNLSPEQDKLLREILEICRYFECSMTWGISADVYAKQAREIGYRMKQLERVSK